MLPAAARAEGWSVDATAATDKVLRGLSLTEGTPSIGVDAAYYWNSGFYADASLARAKPVPADSATGLFVGGLGYLQGGAGDWRTQYGWTHYGYTDAALSSFDFDDFRVTEAYRGTIFVSAGGSPHARMVDAQGHSASGPVFSADSVVRIPLSFGWSADGSLGYFGLQRPYHTGFAYGSLGVTWQIGQFQFDTSLIGTSPGAKRRFGSTADNRLVADCVWRF
ncbi:hypothetical protein [Paraburkholderia phenazinium]|uniref:hypothetical protein n=1 Tax=Paraburkholderia phenazinium TaxID=60549 RepID=UPI000B85563A|nr:hypothetical protein [Paraburkholderia phenazinium]